MSAANESVFSLDLERIEAILPRYAVEGPRYTSYPTAPVWKETYGPQSFRAELDRQDIGPDDGLSLYVHVPFCRSLCHFCCSSCRLRSSSEAISCPFLTKSPALSLACLT